MTTNGKLVDSNVSDMLEIYKRVTCTTRTTNIL